MWVKMNQSQESAFHAGIWEIAERYICEKPDGIYYWKVIL